MSTIRINLIYDKMFCPKCNTRLNDIYGDDADKSDWEIDKDDHRMINVKCLRCGLTIFAQLNYEPILSFDDEVTE